MGILEEEEKEKGTESIFRAVMGENFLKLAKEVDIRIREARGPQQIKPE